MSNSGKSGPSDRIGAAKTMKAAPAGRTPTPAKKAPNSRVPKPTEEPSLHGRPGAVRIVGGRWKRSPIVVPAIIGLRPTPQRVRETLFNWLGPDLTGWRCVDAFAGTGALGFEAASRGADRVTLCEHNRVLLMALHATGVRLDAEDVVEVHAGDGVAYLGQLPAGSVDLVFLDPPFGDDELFDMALAAASRAVASEGFIYLESPVTWTAERLQAFGLVAHRHQRAGMVHGHLLMPLTAE